MNPLAHDILEIGTRLVISGLIGALIGWERRVHHKAIGIAGMLLIAIGSTSYMLLGTHLAEADPSSGIGFLGGAVIFKSGYDVKGIKAAAAVWITGGAGLAIATDYWLLGLTVGIVTAIIMFVSDRYPDEVREEKQEP
jgi:putative Mg2+ transporter-C (MgtC) family protein